ncbi:MAG TPA: hypothetical protein PKY77_18850 [Phycisphaerae bacterium]|nr:hypothetical protein [Phycisphaerae bacterium]HRY68479.1 hypothetical protein [Phycisphaerae bacterium]HSA29526.1 hypothetical protein [Phycisphaerae bacterium]
MPTDGRVLGGNADSPGAGGNTPTEGVVGVVVLGIGPGVRVEDPPSEVELPPVPKGDLVASGNDGPGGFDPARGLEVLPRPVEPVEPVRP